MKKKFWLMMLAVLTALCLALGLAACGGGNNEQGGTTDPGEGGSTNPGEQGGTNPGEGGGTDPGEQGGETNPPTHVHNYTVENVCTECGETMPLTDGLTYQLDESTDTYTVTGIGTAADGVDSLALVIPYGYRGKPVTAIGEAAFAECYVLESVAIPDSVTTIGENAFSDCLIKDVSIGNGVTAIGNGAFAYCAKLAGDLVIPDSVTTIGEEAFLWCTALTSVTIGNGVTSIGEYAFDICPGLTRLSLGSSVAEIGEGAFESSVKLLEVWNHSELPLTCESEEYGSVALYAKHVYNGEEAGHQTVTADGYVFYEEGEESYLLGYRGMQTRLTFPEKSPAGKTYAIYPVAFFMNLQLVSVTLPDSVTAIPDDAFFYCLNLIEFSTGNGVTTIGDEVFANCYSLTKFTLGSSVTSIGEWAFEHCSKLVEVWNHSKLPLETESEEYGEIAMYAKHVYTGEETGYQTITEDGYIFYEEGEERYLLGYCGNQTRLTLPEKSPSGKTYEIYQDAFHQNTTVISVAIGSGVTAIGRLAFFNCSPLKEITLASSVTSIGFEAFTYDEMNVYYAGTPQALELIAGPEDNGLDYTTIYYYSSEAPTEEQWQQAEFWWHLGGDGEILIWPKQSA